VEKGIHFRGSEKLNHMLLNSCLKLFVLLCILLTVISCIAPWYVIEKKKTSFTTTTEYYQLFYIFAKQTCNNNTNCALAEKQLEFWDISDNTVTTRSVFLICWVLSIFTVLSFSVSLSKKAMIYFTSLNVVLTIISVAVFYFFTSHCDKLRFTERMCYCNKSLQFNFWKLYFV